MSDHDRSPDPSSPDPSSPDRNPLGLGSRGGGEGTNSGSTADTSYAARGSDPYRSGEPDEQKALDRTRSTPADPDVPSSDEP